MNILNTQVMLKTHPFTVEEVKFKYSSNDNEKNFYRLKCPDWVNVLPITSDNQALLIRQPRIGSEKSVLEVPAGVVEDSEKNDPTMTAARELEEETGFSSTRVLALGSTNPNPAIMTNRCHFFLALGCQPTIDRKNFPDPDECIEVVPTPLNQLENLVRTGQIDHSLSSLCIFLASKYININS